MRLAFFSLLLTASAVYADTEVEPYPWAVASSSGQYLFKMVPAKWHFDKKEKFVVDRDSYGVAYSLDENGKFVEMWRVKGWFAWRVFLSEDGRYLVRMGPWANDQENHTDLAVAFYDKGKLLKQYEVRELLKDASKVRESVSHYDWAPAAQTQPNGLDGDMFHLVMRDQSAYSFDVTTGEIAEATIDKGAKTEDEVEQDEADEREREGEASFAASSFKADFAKRFVVSQMEDTSAKTHLRNMEEMFPGKREWRAILTPREELKFPCWAAAVFPIAEDGKVKCEISAGEISAALKAVVSHPYVDNWYKTKHAENIVLRISWNQLHRETDVLRGCLKLWKKDTGSLRDWVEFKFSYYQKAQSPFLFLNAKSGELIYQDESATPWEPVLLDASGQRIQRP